MKLHFLLVILLAPIVIYMGFKIREHSPRLGIIQIALGMLWLIFYVGLAILQWRRFR